MRLREIAAAVAACALLLPAGTHAQTKFEWKEVSSPPKGLNMPASVKAEVAGIELGMSFAEAKAVLAKLASEAKGEKPAVKEQTMVARLPAVGSDIRVEYVGSLSLKRDVAGQGERAPTDFIEVNFSAPSSGHQVIDASRTLTYSDPADQPRISETLESLEKRLGMKGSVLSGHGWAKYTFGFANGKPEPITNPGVYCNRDEQCPVQFTVEFMQGLNEDRAKSIGIGIQDKARTQLNRKTDQEFLQRYLDSLSKGALAAPKL